MDEIERVNASAIAEINAAEERHVRELAQANARLDRQIRAEWYREQARAVAALWETVGRASEPIARLAQVIEELVAARASAGPSSGRTASKRQAVSETYVEWKFRLFEVQTAMTAVDMLVEDRALRVNLELLLSQIEAHMQEAKDAKNAAMDHGTGNGASRFMDHINEFNRQQPLMVMDIRRLMSSTSETR